MSKLQSLKNATGLHDVATLLCFKPKALAYILYHKVPAAKYHSFVLQKSSGGTRTIQAPADDLKLLQRNLSDLLQDCSAELNVSNSWKDQIAHGFKRDRSIVSNAYEHKGRRWVFNLDLAGFFDCINFGRVRGFFISNKHFSLHPSVATVLAQIACNDNKLPQGSPCSPVLSNLVAHILDIRLVQLAQKTGCTYTRYADDLTFSTSLINFPALVAVNTVGVDHSWTASVELAKIITRSGFLLNVAKTRMQYHNSRQDVTGLVVNKKVNIKSEYRRKVRAMVYSLFTTGAFYRDNSGTPLSAAGALKTPGTMAQLHGMLGHIDRVDLYNKSISQQVNASSSGSKANIQTKESQYRRFLVFHYFYNAQVPVVICEGKTDNIYLSQAIKHLSANFPSLASVSAANAVSLKVRVFKYPDTSTGRILDLQGGTGDLKNFILSYSDDLKKFKAPGLVHPVIILVDNDGGKTTVGGVISQITKQKPSWTSPYIHVTDNLYVMPTPLLVGQVESAIEDFFPAQTLATVLGGKTFMPKKPFDPAIHYGKAIFAEQVVKKNANAIDFSGFAPILQTIADIIVAHAALQAQPQAVP